LGDELTLLRLRDDGDVGPFVAMAAVRGVPLRVLDLRDQVPAGDYGAALLLVRPDQHVAWRGAAVDRAGAGAIIERACGGSRASGTAAAPAGFRSEVSERSTESQKVGRVGRKVGIEPVRRAFMSGRPSVLGRNCPPGGEDQNGHSGAT